LKKEISDTKASGSSAGGTVCREVEATQIERFLGLSPDAGIQEAINLSKRSEWPIRQFAVEILSEIGTPEAKQQLEILANDKYPAVAYLAKSQIEQLSKARNLVPDAFKRLELEKPIHVDTDQTD
jgi:hypothetical protein